MTVYVDDMRLQARVGSLNARWSHLTVGPGDDLAELHAFAASIGLRRSWFQGPPEHRHPHYDVTDTKRQQAIKAGAKPITWREAGMMLAEAGERRRAQEAMAALWVGDGETPALAAASPGQVVTGEQEHLCQGCGRTDTRLYASGPKCPEHTPAALAGLKEPDTGRYCAPARCYCGQPSCPAAASYTRPLDPIRATILDAKAIASGRRRSKSLDQYRDAQARVQQTRRKAGSP